MANQWVSIIMLVGVILIMYFVLLRPQKKKDDELKSMRAKLKVGDKVLTISGIFGRVYKVKDDRVILEVGPDRVKLEYAKWGISQVLNADGSIPTAKDKRKRILEEDEPEQPAKKMPKKLVRESAPDAKDAAAGSDGLPEGVSVVED